MDQTQVLVEAVVKGLQEKKPNNIAIVDLRQIEGAICQYMVIAEGNSPSQVAALCDSVWDFAKKEAGEKTISIDGEQRAEWIGMDYGTVTVHIFLPEKRKFYNLDTLWEDAPKKEIPNLD